MKTAKRGWWTLAARGLLCLSLTIVSLLAADTSTTMAADTGGQPAANQENPPQPYVWFLYAPPGANPPPPGKKAKGHAALLVFDGTSCHYYSYGPGPVLNPGMNMGFPNDNMFAKNFNTVADAKAYLTRVQAQKDPGDACSTYQFFIRWKITAAQAATIAAVPAGAWTGTVWHLIFPDHNCWNMVFAAISSALNAAHIQTYSPPGPQRNYDGNLNNIHDIDGPIGDMDH